MRAARRTKKAQLAHLKGRQAVTLSGGAGCGSPRTAARHRRTRAVLGISAPVLRPVREVLTGLGQEGAGNARLANFTVHVPGSLAWS
jgi:hypothetical protein